MYYVYLLVSEDGRKYTGYMTDLKKRFAEHNHGVCSTTRGRRWDLVYYEAYADKGDAMRREKRLKDGRARQALLGRVASSLDLFVV